MVTTMNDKNIKYWAVVIIVS